MEKEKDALDIWTSVWMTIKIIPKKQVCLWTKHIKHQETEEVIF